MTESEKSTTKDKILRVAAKLFSERGYDRVGTRDIAKAVGINSASIYYYFHSKEDILKSLYAFYTEERKKECPNLEQLLRLAETEPPLEVLMKTEYHYNDELKEFLNHILFIAIKEFSSDIESERFIDANIFGNVYNILKP